MKTSIKGLIEIAREEGLVPAPYLDAVGVWTFGLGHAETSGLAPNPRNMPRGMPADLDGAIREAFRLFRDHLGVYERGVRKAVNVRMTQQQFDACVSLCFNIGTGGFARSSVARHFNAGRVDKAATAFLAWNKGRVDGKLVRIEGLARRRAREKLIFETGRYPGGSVPVFSVSASNKPIYSRVARQLSEADVAEYLSARTVYPAPTRPTTPPRPPSAPQRPAPAPKGLLAALLSRLLRFLNIGGPA